MSETVANRVKDVRSMLGMSQRDLAEALEVRQATISGWETGSNRPTAGNLRLLSDLCADSMAVYKWLRGDGQRPVVRPKSEAEEEAHRTAAETHGFKTDLGPEIEQIRSLISRSDLSLGLLRETSDALQERDHQACLRAGQVVENAEAATAQARELLGVALDLLKDAHHEEPTGAHGAPVKRAHEAS